MRKIITGLVTLSLIGVSLMGYSQQTNSEPQIKENLWKDTSHISRKIEVDGTTNMRDLGGYITTEGRQVKMGKLFRSEALDDLSEEGVKQLEALKLDTIIDFRGQIEIKAAPDMIPHRVQYINIPITNPADMNEVIPTEARQAVREAFINGETEKITDILGQYPIEDPELGREERYAEFADHWTPEVSKFMKAVLNAEGEPVLFHCAGGKDRTGFAAAALLMTLGVSEEDVMYDYLLTNEYNKEENDYMSANLPEALHAFVFARENYMQSALDHIYDNYEDFDDYRRNALDISDEEQAQLKELLLQ